MEFALTTVVQGNFIGGNTGPAVALSISSAFSTVAGNSVAADDIVVTAGASRSAVDSNWIHTGGIQLSGTGDVRVTRNTLIGSPADAISLTQDTRPVVEGNLISGAALNGIAVGLNVDGRLTGNLLTGSVRDGIFVAADPAKRTVVERNAAGSNGDDGIDTDRAATTVTRNAGYQNSDLGIEAVAGVTDGGGNRAGGNGNAAQCSPSVSCAP